MDVEIWPYVRQKSAERAYFNILCMEPYWLFLHCKCQGKRGIRYVGFPPAGDRELSEMFVSCLSTSPHWITHALSVELKMHVYGRNWCRVLLYGHVSMLRLLQIFSAVLSNRILPIISWMLGNFCRRKYLLCDYTNSILAKAVVRQDRPVSTLQLMSFVKAVRNGSEMSV